jgi:hypothetical protein
MYDYDRVLEDEKNVSKTTRNAQFCSLVCLFVFIGSFIVYYDTLLVNKMYECENNKLTDSINAIYFEDIDNCYFIYLNNKSLKFCQTKCLNIKNNTKILIYVNKDKTRCGLKKTNPECKTQSIVIIVILWLIFLCIFCVSFSYVYGKMSS